MSFLSLAVQNGGKTWCFRLSLVLPCPFGSSSLYGRDVQMGVSSLPGFWANYILSFFSLLETTVWVTQEGTAGEGGGMIQAVFKNRPPPRASSDRSAPLPYNFLLVPTPVLYLPDSLAFILTRHYLYKMPRSYYDASGSKQPSRIWSLWSSCELMVSAWPVSSGRQTLQFVISLPVLKQDAHYKEINNRSTMALYNLVLVLSIMWHCSCHKFIDNHGRNIFKKIIHVKDLPWHTDNNA